MAYLRRAYFKNDHTGKTWTDKAGVVHCVLGETGTHHLMACGADYDIDDYPEFFTGVVVTCLGCLAQGPSK